MTLEGVPSVHARDRGREHVRRKPAHGESVAVEFVAFGVGCLGVAAGLSGARYLQLFDYVVLLLEQPTPLDRIRPLMLKSRERNCALATGEEHGRGRWEERRSQDRKEFFEGFGRKTGPRRRSLRWDIFIREFGDLAVVDLRVFVCEPDSLEMIRRRDHSRTGEEGIKPDRARSHENGVVVCGERHLR